MVNQVTADVPTARDNPKSYTAGKGIKETDKQDIIVMRRITKANFFIP